jgi:short-subunit dehydrogenase
MANIAVYSATKHAVKGFTEALSVELKAAGVRVADTLPGLIDTPILPDIAKTSAPSEGMWRLIPPIEVAKAVWDAYHQDRIHWYVPPELYDFDQLATAHPEQVRDQMATQGLFNRAEDPA